MKNHFDVIVVGLGPAGATAAYYLAKSGLSVLALDKYKFPRMKPCGGGITAKGISVTDIDWSPCVEFKAHQVKLVCRNQPALEFISPTPLIYMVSRPTFDKFLVKQAEEQGTNTLYKEKVKVVKQKRDKVIIGTENQTFTATYLIGADGALGIVRRQIFDEAKNRNLYLAAETESCPVHRNIDTSNEEIYFHLGSIPSGYGWVFGKDTHQSVGVYGTSEKLKIPVRWYHRFTNKYARQVNHNHVPVRVHPIPVYQSNHQIIAKERVLLVGDAAGLVDPLLGEGIYYAMRSGRIAGESIINNFENQDRVSMRYIDKIEKEICQELAVAEKLAQLIYQFPSISFRLFREYPDAFNQFCHVLSGTRTYRECVNQLKSDLLTHQPLLTRFLLGTNRLRILLST